jgi:hypothetical protein
LRSSLQSQTRCGDGQAGQRTVAGKADRETGHRRDLKTLVRDSPYKLACSSARCSRPKLASRKCQHTQQTLRTEKIPDLGVLHGWDVSLAADVKFPDPKSHGDRKAVLVIRQSLDDDSKEAMIGEHGVGMIHLAWRPDRGAMMKDAKFRFGGTLAGIKARRIGIEKHGDSIAIFVSLEGEPMHQLGPPVTLHFDEPFYVGIGFCSHLPATSDTAALSNVVLANSAGKVE